MPAYDEFLLFKQLLQEIQKRNLGLFRTRDHVDSVEDDAISEIGGPKAACVGDDNRTFESKSGIYEHGSVNWFHRGVFLSRLVVLVS